MPITPTNIVVFDPLTGKIPVSALPDSVMENKGGWNASTNTPTLADGIGNLGDTYNVTVAGTQDLGSGPIIFSLGQSVQYNGTIWFTSTAVSFSLTGDVTGSGSGSAVTTIAANVVSNSKLAQIATATVKGRTAASTGNVEDLDIATTLKTALSLTKSDVGLGNVDNTQQQPIDQDLTDIAALTPSNDDFMQRKAGAWTNRTPAQAKTDLNLSGTNTGDQTITLTGAVTGSGTGSFATTLASGIDAIKIADGSVTNTEFQYLNSVTSDIQTQINGKQVSDATLTSIAALGTAADRVAYTTGIDTWAETPLTAAARTVIDDASVSDMVDTLGGATSTGTGGLVRATSPTLVTPNLGTPSTLIGTNITGTATNFTSSNVTTNANLTGEVTSVGNAATVPNATVIGKVLTGFSSTPGVVAATDTILQAINKLDGNVSALDASVILKGLWDASAGTFPGGGVAQAGWSYIVSVGGTVDSVPFVANDRIIAILDNASTTTFASNWFKADYTDQVLSVFSRTGAVTAISGDYTVAQVTNAASVLNPLSQFSATTSAQLAGVLSDETGTGSVVFSNSPTLVTPELGTPSALVGTNITGTAAGLTSGNVTTNANLTGAVTSVGNAASLGSFTSANLSTALTDETGSGSAVFATSPTLVTPVLGVATATTVNKVALTTPASGSTLTIIDGKTLTANNTLTFSGTDTSTLNIGSGGTLGTAAYQNTGSSGSTIPFCNGANTFAPFAISAVDGTSEGAQIDWAGAGTNPSWTQDVAVNFMRFFTNSATNTGVSMVNIGTGTMSLLADGSVVVGPAIGGFIGTGSINISSDIYRNSTAYTNPDYVLELWATGKIEKFKDNDGAKGYVLPSLDEIETSMRETYRLPRMTDEPLGSFGRQDWLLEKMEEAFICIIELKKEIEELKKGSKPI